MKLTRYISVLLLLFGSISIYAQNINLEGIRLQKEYPAHKSGRTVDVNMQVDLTEMPAIGSNLKRIVTPVLRANEGQKEVVMPSFVVAGRNRYSIIRRRTSFDNNYKTVPDQTENTIIVLRKNGSSQQLHYQTTIAYEPWMKNASLIFSVEDTGCADCPLGSGEKTLTKKALYPLYEAQYKFNIIIPEGELVKNREEILNAHISFRLGKYDILPDFQNNSQELARIRAKLNELRGNEDVTFNKLDLIGYASPEGGTEFNDRLSKKRVESFAGYLSSQYLILRGRLHSEWKGADWEGLKKRVRSMSFSAKDEVLDILELPIQQRTPALKKLDNGKVYSMLLEEVYPPLRRTELIFNIQVKGFSLEKARQIIKAHPSRLSLAEVYAVAKSYPEGSKEQYEVWVIADRAFPKNVEPVINVAVLDIKAGRCREAVEKLEKRSKDSRVWGMLGLAYAYNQNWEKAEKYLQKARKNGDKEAAYNLDEMQKYIKDNF